MRDEHNLEEDKNEDCIGETADEDDTLERATEKASAAGAVTVAIKTSNA